MSGNCTDIKTRALNFENGKELSNIATDMSLSDSVTTEVNLIGCTITVEQMVANAQDMPIAHIAGNLDVEDENALTGTLAYQEFLPDGVTQACASEVQVSYIRQGPASGVQANGQLVTFGAAAQAALEQP